MAARTNGRQTVTGSSVTEDAFAELVARHRLAAWRVALAIVGDATDAQDVLQETLLAAWNGLPGLREPDRVGAWLVGIAANKARQALRSTARRRALSERLTASAITVGGHPNAALWDAIDALPGPQSEAVLMHYVGGYTYQEIAESVGVPASTIRGRLHRARAGLRKECLDMVRSLQLDVDAMLLEFLHRRAHEQGASVTDFVTHLLAKYQRGHENHERTVHEHAPARRKPIPDALPGKPAQALVRRFFDACLANDYDTASALVPYGGVRWERTDYARAVEIVDVGEPYCVSGASPGNAARVFVPYHLRFPDGGEKRWRVALCYEDDAWRVDGGL